MDIEKIARECGAKWPDSAECELTRAELHAFASAVRRETLEEAARVCVAAAEAHASSAKTNFEAFSSDEGEGQAAGAAYECAQSIRALAEPRKD